MSFIKKIAVVGIVVGAMSSATALACGDWLPKHGGEMSTDGGDVSFELSTSNRNVIIYVEDHGTMLPTAGATGAVSVKNASRSWSAPLVADGANRLRAVGPQIIMKGDEVNFTVNFSDGKSAEGSLDYGLTAEMRLNDMLAKQKLNQTALAK